VLSGKLVDQICEATGGYCTYDGLDMRTAHSGLCITNQQFAYFMGDVMTAMRNLKVPVTIPPPEKPVLLGDALVAALYDMQPEIVQACAE
jgi:hemoglobin